MYSRISLLLLLLLPVAVAFPAQPSFNVLHPRHIHQTFLQLKARRIRHATVKFASKVLSADAQLTVSARLGLAFEPCSASDECQAERSCVQLAGDTSGLVELADCDAGLCFCADMDGCSSVDDCLTGESCAPGGTCVSNSFVPGAAPADEVDPTLGLNLDPCESIADCQNPRNCVQFVGGDFGQCAGPNCFCVRRDPSCTSTSECSQGESCTQREGSNNAICISETAIINGEATEEEIDEIPDTAPELPPMTDMTPATPVATVPGDMDTPDAEETTDTDDTPDVLPVPVPGTPEEPATTAPLTTATPATTAPPAPTVPAPTVPATTVPTPTVPATTVPATTEGDPEETEPEQADREPVVVLPGADGASVSPDTEEGEEVVPSDTVVDAGPTEEIMGEDGEVTATPGEEIIDPDVTVTPDADGEFEDELGPTPSPEEVICIGEHHLVHLPRDELLYSSNRVARVLCDENNSCATPGHIVMYNDKPMMMSSYCAKTSCAPKIMKVNSPRYRRAARVDSHTGGLSFTAFAARYETTAEEHLLRSFVRMGL